MKGVLGIMAKTPRPGKVKTRLAASVGPQLAADFATASLRDTWRAFGNLAELPACLVLAGDAVPRLTPPPTVWPQASGDLGARMEAALRLGLQSADYAILIGMDSPGLPARFLRQAARQLRRYDAVLGPSEDGGFYLIGLRRCPRGLLAGLPWSSRDTLTATRTRLMRHDLRIAMLPRWFDVDDAEGLARLKNLLARGALDAPHCARLLGATPGAELLDRS